MVIGITLLENSKNVGIIFLIILLLYFVISIPAMISVTVRRLHDIGYNGAWFFISFIPLIGGVWAFVLSVLDSQVGENRFGNNPWGIGNGADAFCSNCGKKTEKDDNKVSFCTHCGEKVYIDSDEEKESQKKNDVWV